MKLSQLVVLSVSAGFAGGLLESLYSGRQQSMFKPIYAAGFATASLVSNPLAALVAIPSLELVTGLTLNKDHRYWDYGKGYKGQIAFPETLLLGVAGALVAWRLPFTGKLESSSSA